jgi:hypothetical protein
MVVSFFNLKKPKKVTIELIKSKSSIEKFIKAAIINQLSSTNNNIIRYTIGKLSLP